MVLHFNSDNAFPQRLYPVMLLQMKGLYSHQCIIWNTDNLVYKDMIHGPTSS